MDGYPDRNGIVFNWFLVKGPINPFRDCFFSVFLGEFVPCICGMCMENLLAKVNN